MKIGIALELAIAWFVAIVIVFKYWGNGLSKKWQLLQLMGMRNYVHAV